MLDIDQPVGRWKTQSNFTIVTSQDNKQQWREYPAPDKIAFLMSQWLARLNSSLATIHQQDMAATIYADLQLSFVTIHPFFDGNGRLARLLANLPVLKSRFPPIVVPQEDRYRYKLCLSDYQNTVENLAELRDLVQLPANAEKQRFIELCKGYWSETLELLENAKAMQRKRNLSLDQ